MYHKLMLENQGIFTKKVLKKLSQHSLSSGQPRILEYLSEHEGIMQKDIAKACILEPPSVTSVLGKMEKENLISKHINQDNKRSMYVTLTEQGKEKAKVVEEVIKEEENKALKGLTSEEIETLLNLLRKINKNLKEEN